jgi:hypothetical protein
MPAHWPIKLKYRTQGGPSFHSKSSNSGGKGKAGKRRAHGTRKHGKGAANVSNVAKGVK